MVNLLYSNPLPQPQFASLSILLQLDIPPQYSNNHSSSSGDDDYGEIIHNISSDEIVALTNANADAVNNNNLKVSTTIVQLPDNTTKEVPLYPKGLVVNYCQRKSSSSSNDDAAAADDDDGAPTASTTTTMTTPATIMGVHYDDTLEPYYTIRLHSTGMEKQTDNAHIAQFDTQQEQQDNNDDDDDEEVRKDEADKSAGPPTSSSTNPTTTNNTPPPPTLKHTVLRETITIISPQTLVTERSHIECMDGLHLNIMKEYGLKDDFLGVGADADEKSDNDGKEQEEGGSSSRVEDDMNSRSATPVMSQNNSKVRFDNGTKGGSTTAASSSKTPSIITTGDDGGNKKNCFQDIPIKVYQPNHTTTCGLGMTMYYLAVYAKDITKFIEGGNGNDEEDGDDDPMIKALFRHCASVLVPGISGGGGGKGNGGVIVLTVGSTGPPYDLFGASSIITTLPSRLREGMTLLSLVDTTTTPNNKEGLLDSMNGVLQQQQQQRRQTPTEKDGKSRFSFRGGKNSTPRSSQQKSLQQQQVLNNQSVMTTATYDSAYFKRLYMALLATILDDENGYMREHDDIVIMESVPFTPGSTTSVIRSPRTPSTTALLADQGMTSSGTSRKNRFTFSRKKNKSEQEYALGNNDANNENIVKDGGGAESSTNNAGEIVRRMAQKLEVLSIADEEMPIPRYSHMIGGGDESNNGGGGGGAGTPRSRKSARIPGAASSSGRFGRPAVASDLSGFEYRPSAAQQRMAGGGGGMSVSGFTTSTEGMSEDASVMTGDQSAYSASTQSSIPTLSRSKRDDSSTSSSSTRSRRFFFMKKKKSPKKKMGKQLEPLSAIPQDQELQPVYDPFGNDDDDTNSATNNVTAEKGVFQSLNSTTVPLVREDPPPAPPPEELDVDDVNIKLSHSYESEGKESYVSGASTAPESVAEPEEEPTRHLDISLALNEDLTCEYKKSKLSTLSVEGTIQVRMSTSYEGEVPQDVPPTIPFVLLFKDHSGHVRTLQENKKFVENVSHESEVANREFTYTITIPREEEYFPVVRYKCDTSLRPVPIRVQTRIRTQGKFCRVALQISSNPQNPSDLVHLTVIMGVPPGLKGESLKCNPPGGVWNESKRVVLWCVSELGGGEKFQLQAIFEMSDDLIQTGGVDPSERLEFPVMARCQCAGAQLSDVALDVSAVDDMFPAEVSKNVIRRFRVSHREKK